MQGGALDGLAPNFSLNGRVHVLGLLLYNLFVINKLEFRVSSEVVN